ncbi:MAG: hydrogenase maturation nickel metallochaperone HypA [bacterium]
MHESAMIDSFVDIVEKKVAEFDVKRVTKIKLKVGKLTCLAPTTLKNCFDVVAEERDLLRGAVLEVEEVPLKAECHQCHKVFLVENNLFSCPYCHHEQIKIVAGRELFIESVEVE